MFKIRKAYDLEYKEYLSRMVVEERRKISELAREFNISRATLYQWVADYKENTGWVEQHKTQEKRARIQKL